MTDEPLQITVTRIGVEAYRLVVQSEKRTLYTANVEKKHLDKAIEAEIDRLAVIPMNWSF